MKKLLLIDGNSILYRAYYATAYSGEMLQSISGTPTNGVYGFANILNKILKLYNYYTVIVTFDKGKKTFRHELLKSYKAGRSKTPNELIAQFPIAKEFLNAYNILFYEQDNYEADDLIGCIANKAVEENFFVDILSSDKDLFQLISDKINILLPKQGDNPEIYNLDALKARWNILPSQVPDLKGLMGDASDNLKGIPGIGEKTAIKLLTQYKTIEGIYEHLDEISGKMHKNLLEHKADAFLCKEVATIVCELDFTNKKDFFTPLVINEQQLANFYNKYDMHSLANRLKNVKDKKTKIEIKVKQIEKWDKQYEKPINAVYLEIFGENYHRDEKIAFGIANENGVYYYDYALARYDEGFHHFLGDKTIKKVVYNAKALIVSLFQEHIIVNNIVDDLLLAGYIYNSNVKDSFETYLSLFMQVQIESNETFFGKGVKKHIPVDSISLINFIGTKTYYLLKMYNKVISLLEKSNQLDLYREIELPVTFALAQMEINGVKVDRKELTYQSERIALLIEQLAQQINELAHKEISPNSPKQLSELLYRDLKLPDYAKGSTAQEVLENLKNDYPIVNKILEYRKYAKLYSTYLKGLEKYIFTDGKVHTIYKQTFTNTGRLSSIEPNMQNISVRDEVQREVRKIFVVSSEDYQLLSCDYSQIELRLLAHMSEDKNLILAFNNNEDIHTNTAAKVFNVPAIEVTPALRRMAKAVNFGIIYGISDFGLAKDLNISVSKAKEIILNYYQQYPTIKNFIDLQVSECQKKGYVVTLFNRKRYVPEINDKNYMQREFGKRIAMNMPLQGTAADIIKLALSNIHQYLIKNKYESKIIAQIHDELIFEIKKTEEAILLPKIKDLMMNAVHLKVKLDVNCKQGKTWYDLK